MPAARTLARDPSTEPPGGQKHRRTSIFFETMTSTLASVLSTLNSLASVKTVAPASVKTLLMFFSTSAQKSQPARSSCAKPIVFPASGFGVGVGAAVATVVGAVVGAVVGVDVAAGAAQAASSNSIAP